MIVNQGKLLAGDGLEELREALADAGHADPPWREVPKSKKAPKQVVELVEKCDVDRLLVWGGDGTVRRCIDTLLAEGLDHVAIGVLPAGTGNLLANNLGIPIDLRGAVDVALHGEPVPLDVGIVNDDQHFVVMAGAGFDACCSSRRPTTAASRTASAGSATCGRGSDTATSARHAVQIAVDGSPWYVGGATTVIAGNVGTLIGGVSRRSPTPTRPTVG